MANESLSEQASGADYYASFRNSCVLHLALACFSRQDDPGKAIPGSTNQLGSNLATLSQGQCKGRAGTPISLFVTAAHGLRQSDSELIELYQVVHSIQEALVQLNRPDHSLFLCCS